MRCHPRTSIVISVIFVIEMTISRLAVFYAQYDRRSALLADDGHDAALLPDRKNRHEHALDSSRDSPRVRAAACQAPDRIGAGARRYRRPLPHAR